MESDYNKGYTYLCSIANYIETKEDLIRKLKEGGVSDPNAVFNKLLADEEIVPGNRAGTYILKFKKCRGGEDEDIISE